MTFNGDLEMFDGYDELSEEDQLRVRKALEAGHIDDADCSPNVVSLQPSLAVRP